MIRKILITRNIYHFRYERGRNLLLYQIIPVDGGEEVVGFDLVLKIRENKNSIWSSKSGRRGRSNPAHKIIPGAQPVCAVLLQQPLQEGPGCAGGPRAHPQRLVENVVVHFVCISAVEWWLRCEIKETRMHVLQGTNNVSATVWSWNSPIQTAFHTTLSPDTTSPPCYHMAASSAPQGLNTEEKAHICIPQAQPEHVSAV